MKILKNKKVSIITLVLILTSAAFVATIPLTVKAPALPMTSQGTVNTWAFLSVSPKTVQLGKQVLVNAWITPPPDKGWVYDGYYFDITKPDGTTISLLRGTMGTTHSDPAGTTYWNYMPDQIGTYSVVFRWAGVNNTLSWQYRGTTGEEPLDPRYPYEPVESSPATFTVQEDPPTQIAPPILSLPTGYWERPVSADNKGWEKLGGNWLLKQDFGDSWREDGLGNSRSNPFSDGPKSAHIAWIKKPTLSGLIGDDYGGLSNPTHSMISIVISGVGYYQSGGLHAVDIRTGEELWVNPDMKRTPTLGQPGQYLYTPGLGSSAQTPSLWYLSENAVEQYSAVDGRLLKSYPGLGAIGRHRVRSMAFDVKNDDGGIIVYWSSMRYPDTDEYFWQDLVGSDIHMWNSSKPGDDKIEFMVEGVQVETRGFIYLYDDVFVSAFHPSSNFQAYNSITGQLLWNVTRTDQIQMGNGAVGYGKYFYPSATDQSIHAMDIRTGAEVWVSDPGEYPWAAFWAYDVAVAYEKVYFQTYDGHVYAFDVNTGDTVWSYFSGENTYTPYNTLPFYDDIVVAGGMVYAGQTEHSPTMPYLQGRQLFGFDAETGEVIWSIASQPAAKVIADGVLVTVDDYTGQLIGFGKSRTETSVTALPKIITDGDKILIEGMVTDQSPAQPGTPAISDDNMSAWMEYLHMSKPKPTNAKGVDVTIDVIDANGNYRTIGTATSDMSGFYSLDWKPDIPGKYTVIATFEGSESYWSSYTETAFVVEEAPAATPPPEATPAPMTDTYIAGSTIAILAGIAVAVFLILRKK